jgi:hypothetical protein
MGKRHRLDAVFLECVVAICLCAQIVLFQIHMLGKGTHMDVRLSAWWLYDGEDPNDFGMAFCRNIEVRSITEV